MAPVALSIIGYGIMGERLLGAAMAHDPRIICVAGVWDPSPQALARLAAGFASVARLPSPEAAIEAADCVYIASPPATLGSHSAFCASLPNRRMAPLPSPCMAKAKSASPL